jgi:hypothetical protein
MIDIHQKLHRITTECLHDEHSGSKCILSMNQTDNSVPGKSVFTIWEGHVAETIDSVAPLLVK